MERTAAAPRRRLIIRPGAIGDSILSFPALEHLRAEYTEVWVRSDIVPLVRFADAVRSISSTGIDLAGIPDVDPPTSLIERLRSFDEIVSWYGANRPEFKDFVGSFCKNVRFLSALPPAGTRVHAADYFLRQAGGTGMAVARIETGVSKPGDYIVLHPFSGSEKKNWPLENFVELERELTAWGFSVEWAARPGQVRFEDLWGLGQWISGGRLYVGNDSGITHLAAAVGASVVAFFGPTDPNEWGPRGERVTIVRGRSLQEISLQSAMAAVLQAMARAEAGG